MEEATTQEILITELNERESLETFMTHNRNTDRAFNGESGVRFLWNKQR